MDNGALSESLSKERYAVVLTEDQVRRLWRGIKRDTIIRVDIEIVEPDSNPLVCFNTKLYSIALHVATASRKRVVRANGRKDYDYEYIGHTAWNSLFQMQFSDDGFDPRRYIYLDPPEDPMDWARTFG